MTTTGSDAWARDQAGRPYRSCFGSSEDSDDTTTGVDPWDRARVEEPTGAVEVYLGPLRLIHVGSITGYVTRMSAIELELRVVRSR